jgi:osmoprotectant transport system ATP-binding protein
LVTQVQLDEQGRIIGDGTLRVHARDDLRQVLACQFAKGVSWAACVDDHERFQGYVMQADILASLVDDPEVARGA